MQRTDNHIPDVLDCLASLSNDEVFTPPRVVNQMLDLLPEEVFKSRETTFLDPFTKSGVFLREITKRLLEYQVPKYNDTAFEIEQITKFAIQEAVSLGKLNSKDNDYELKARAIGDAAIKNHKDADRFFKFKQQLQEALDHILTKQVFGIAITELTAQLARRSLYCSKNAAGQYSISESVFKGNQNGNIRFVPMKHTWENGSCVYCGASASNLDRPDDCESHAYEFIHQDIKDICKEFGNMEFTVVCGNPPYQLNTAGDSNGAQAKPIYHLFVEQACRLNPRYLLMIIPSRWFAGGWGLDNFRNHMMLKNHIIEIHDFPDSEYCFAGVKIAGGVCYFLYSSTYDGMCNFVEHSSDSLIASKRYLKEPGCDVVIRYNFLVDIFRKVIDVEGLSFSSFSSIVSGRSPFGFNTNHYGDEKPLTSYHIPYLQNKGNILYMDKRKVTRNASFIDKPKVFISKVYGLPYPFPSQIINKPILGKSGMICSGTYLLVGPFDTDNETKNVYTYMKTKFFRLLALINKVSQDVSSKVYSCIPMQDFSKPWTDAELYEKYKLTKQEIDFIESMIKPME